MKVWMGANLPPARSLPNGLYSNQVGLEFRLGIFDIYMDMFVMNSHLLKIIKYRLNI